MAAALQAGVDKRHVPRGPADVEARNDAENLHALRARHERAASPDHNSATLGPQTLSE